MKNLFFFRLPGFRVICLSGSDFISKRVLETAIRLSKIAHSKAR